MLLFMVMKVLMARSCKLCQLLVADFSSLLGMKLIKSLLQQLQGVHSEKACWLISLAFLLWSTSSYRWILVDRAVLVTYVANGR